MLHARSENLFTRAFWLGTVDARALGLFRIAFGLTLLHDLADWIPDLHAFLTDDGMLPRSTLHANPANWWARGAFDLVGSQAGVAMVFAIGCFAVALFTLGVFTRAATIVSWLFLLSLHHRNPYVTDGADDLARVLLLWSILVDLGARYSVDAWRSGRTITDVPALGARLMQAQVATLYLVTAILKLRGGGWLSGDGVFRTLQLDGYQRPLGAWLLGHPALCAMSSRVVPFVELAIAGAAFCPLWPRITRSMCIVLGAGLQLGILCAMRVGMFTELMLAVLTLWIPFRVPAVVVRPEEEFGVARVVRVAFVVQFVIAIWDPFLGRRAPLPHVVQDERLLLSVALPYSLFDLTYEVAHWDALGLLVDGSHVDVLSVVAPATQARGPGWHHHRWNKLTFKSLERPLEMPALVAYFCRSYDAQTSSIQLASFTIVRTTAPARARDAPVNASLERRETLFRHTCDDVAVSALE
jgi:hypothetical protein